MNRSWLATALLAIFPANAFAGEEAGIRLDLGAHIDDAPIERTLLSLTTGSARRYPAAGSLSYHIVLEPAEGGRITTRLTLEDSQGNPLPRTMTSLTASAGQTLAMRYALCGDRVIMQHGSGHPRCANLPPMAKVDPRPDGCIECLGAYEGFPGRIRSRARMVPRDEPGERLIVTGLTLGPDGRPRSGVVVYAFQTNQAGVYPDPEPARSTFSQSHGRLRAWARTDRDGRFTFDTIRPGAYPDGREPEHIHMVVIEPGCATYFIEDIHFSDDPLLGKVPEQYRGMLFSGIGGSGLRTPYRDKSGAFAVSRDIELGKNVENYPGCGDG